jgi:F-type H+-transporting ATPase subunit b
MLTGLCALQASSLAGMWQAGGGVDVDFDKTFLMQMVLFSLLIVVLKPLLFDPVLRIFEQREKRTEGARAEARHMQEKAGELLQKYERELERVNQVAAEERERLRAETAKLEATIVHEAREVATRIADEGRQRIEAELGTLRQELGRRSQQLASDLARRVLGREVG